MAERYSPEEMLRREFVRSMLASHRIRPSRALGQNFLTDLKAAKRIVAAGEFTPSDHLVEIGTGLGALTLLAGEAAHCITSIEKDRGVFEAAGEILGDRHGVRVVHDDGVRFADHRGAHVRSGPIKILSNLPYSGYYDLLFAFMNSAVPVDSMTLVIQREVHAKLGAAPGTEAYGPLAVFVPSMFRIVRVGTIPRGAFYPVPHVDSVLISLMRLARPRVAPGEVSRLVPVVARMFSGRRKKFRNAVADSEGMDVSALPGRLLDSRVEGWDPETILSVARTCGKR